MASADGTDKKLQSKKLLQVSPWDNWTGGVGSRQFQGSGREPSASSITSDTPANYFAEKILRSLLQIRASEPNWIWIPWHIPKWLLFPSWGRNTTHLLPFHFILEVDNYFDVPASFFPGGAISSVI